MLTCYLDEAGDERDGFIVVCGFVSTLALWEQFLIDWRLLLASYGVPYFHMKEFSQSKGPFKHWATREVIRRKFMSDATDIIKQRTQRWVLSYMHYPLFERADKRYMLRETLSSPYAVAGRVCVAEVEQWCRMKTSPPQDVEFIFEDGGPDKGGLLKAMNVAHKLPDPIFRPSRDVKDKRGNPRKGIVQLQAADFLAYELRKHRVEFSKKSGRPARMSFHQLFDVPGISMSSCYEGNIASLCQLNELPERVVS